MMHSNQLGEFTLNQLRDIIQEYPFFQLARLLYLKNLHVLQKPEFEVELKKSVVYIYNRSFLYYLLFEQDGVDQTPARSSLIEHITTQTNEEKSENVDFQADSTTENNTTDVEENKSETSIKDKKEEQPEAPIKRDFTSDIQQNISGLLNDQIKAAEKKTEVELGINQVQLDIEKEYGKDLEKVSTKQDAFVLLEDDQGDIDDTGSPQESADKKRISETISYAKGLLEFDYVFKNKLNYNSKVANNTDFDTEKNPGKNFTEWIEKFNDPNEKTDPEENREHTTQENKDATEAKNQIIDKFIETNPAIRPKDQPFKYEDISTESIKEDDELVTDTLARIYYNQGRYDKALDAYEKLSLKYPEKSSYFAVQIEKTKKKLNDLK